jgi:hypothetical protein
LLHARASAAPPGAGPGAAGPPLLFMVCQSNFAGLRKKKCPSAAVGL